MEEKILEKIDIFLTNETRIYGEDVKGRRPIQFMKWWRIFRPGDRVDAVFGDGFINLLGTNANGSFAGVKKAMKIETDSEIEEFKAMERDIWNFC